MIRALLGAADKTKRELGDHLGLSEPQMSKRMKGTIPWRHPELVAIADYFGVSVGTLFRDPMESLKTRSEKSERAADRRFRVVTGPKKLTRSPSNRPPLLATL